MAESSDNETAPGKFLISLNLRVAASRCFDFLISLLSCASISLFIESFGLPPPGHLT